MDFQKVPVNISEMAFFGVNSPSEAFKGLNVYITEIRCNQLRTSILRYVDVRLKNITFARIATNR